MKKVIYEDEVFPVWMMSDDLSERGRVCDIPDDLVNRYNAALKESWAVEKLLKEYYYKAPPRDQD